MFDTSSVNGHIAIQNSDGTFGHNPDMKGGPIPPGGNAQTAMQGLMLVSPASGAIPGEVRREDPKDFKGWVTIKVTPVQAAALSKSIAQHMKDPYNVQNKTARNCAGWVCERLADAKISPIRGDTTGQFFRNLARAPYLTPRQVGEHIITALTGGTN